MKNLEKQSVLKKQFREEDIQRVRNLVTGKYGSKINQSVGYKKPDIIRKEGEVWEEDGRTKITDEMGYVSSVKEARKMLEKLYKLKDNKES